MSFPIKLNELPFEWILKHQDDPSSPAALVDMVRLCVPSLKALDPGTAKQVIADMPARIVSHLIEQIGEASGLSDEGKPEAMESELYTPSLTDLEKAIQAALPRSHRERSSAGSNSSGKSTETRPLESYVADTSTLAS